MSEKIKVKFKDLEKARLVRRHSIEEATVELCAILARAGSPSRVGFPWWREAMRRERKGLAWNPSQARQRACVEYIRRAMGGC